MREGKLAAALGTHEDGVQSQPIAAEDICEQLIAHERRRIRRRAHDREGPAERFSPGLQSSRHQGHAQGGRQSDDPASDVIAHDAQMQIGPPGGGDPSGQVGARLPGTLGNDRVIQI